MRFVFLNRVGVFKVCIQSYWDKRKWRVFRRFLNSLRRVMQNHASSDVENIVIQKLFIAHFENWKQLFIVAFRFDVWVDGGRVKNNSLPFFILLIYMYYPFLRRGFECKGPKEGRIKPRGKNRDTFVIIHCISPCMVFLTIYTLLIWREREGGYSLKTSFYITPSF